MALAVFAGCSEPAKAMCIDECQCPEGGYATFTCGTKGGCESACNALRDSFSDSTRDLAQDVTGD